MNKCKRCRYYSDYQQECSLYNLNEFVLECPDFKEKEQ